jgi:hypothetical protein
MGKKEQSIFILMVQNGQLLLLPSAFLGSVFLLTLNLTIMRMCHVIAFAGGVLAGGAIALLFAPKKGEDLRKDIKNKLYDIKKKLDESACGCKDGCCTEEKADVIINE